MRETFYEAGKRALVESKRKRLAREEFAAIAAVAIEACGADAIKLLLEAVIEQEGREPS